jgi:hypothetical protein
MVSASPRPQCGCESTCRHTCLVEVLKEVMIGAVYQSDARRSISKRLGRRQPSESSADNNNLDLSHRLPLGSLGDCDLRRSGEVCWTFLEKRDQRILPWLSPPRAAAPQAQSAGRNCRGRRRPRRSCCSHGYQSDHASLTHEEIRHRSANAAFMNDWEKTPSGGAFSLDWQLTLSPMT